MRGRERESEKEEEKGWMCVWMWERMKEHDDRSVEQD